MELIAAAKAKGADVSQPIRYACPTDTADSGKICPIIKQQLEDVGLKVNIMSMDNDTFNTFTSDPTNREKYDMQMIQGGGGLDPSSSAFHASAPFHSSNPLPPKSTTASAGGSRSSLPGVTTAGTGHSMPLR